ncbi:hypothetical protein SAMN02745221_02201 [Thermosyntropha lipolytica DSM 11003]|uniref:Uncharacterized protein n=1 Tax=Thermosyntropha lipolytica DSM 11003 TaxID=1123382 RepID=A0A1M5SDL7_9FIRM|nr:geobacillin-26 family protein [Thermosyntropha lipolytica]SHH36023.1 hypothetical protein SAMN02745221_02201 [Thermosyntropha lipolytica DSM 11003]
MLNKYIYFKKIISLTLCLCLIFTLYSTAYAADYIEQSNQIIINGYTYKIVVDDDTKRQVKAPDGTIATYFKENNVIEIFAEDSTITIDLNDDFIKQQETIELQSNIFWENQGIYNWKYRYIKYVDQRWQLRIAYGLGFQSYMTNENTNNRPYLFEFKNCVDTIKSCEQNIAAAGFGALLSLFGGPLIAALTAAGASGVIIANANQLNNAIDDANTIFWYLHNNHL